MIMCLKKIKIVGLVLAVFMISGYSKAMEGDYDSHSKIDYLGLWIREECPSPNNSGSDKKQGTKRKREENKKNEEESNKERNVSTSIPPINEPLPSYFSKLLKEFQHVVLNISKESLGFQKVMRTLKQYEKKDFFKEAIKQYAQFANQQNVFHVAAEGYNVHGGTGIYPYLKDLAGWGIDINQRDNKGNSPLHYVLKKAEDKDSTGCARALVEAGADAFMLDNEGNSSVFLVVKWVIENTNNKNVITRFNEVLREVERKGAQKLKEELEKIDIDATYSNAGYKRVNAIKGHLQKYIN